MAIKFANPLGYTCAANSAGPTIIVEASLERFLAWGLAFCYQSLFDDETTNADTSDVFWLRKDFLETLEIAREWLPMAREEATYSGYSEYHGDLADCGPTVPVRPPYRTANTTEVACRWFVGNYEASEGTVMIGLDIDGCESEYAYLVAAQLERADAASLIEETESLNAKWPGVECAGRTWEGRRFQDGSYLLLQLAPDRSEGVVFADLENVLTTARQVEIEELGALLDGAPELAADWMEDRGLPATAGKYVSRWRE